MIPEHLTNEVWPKIAQHSLGKSDQKALIDHLDEDCENCDEFLIGFGEEIEGFIRSFRSESALIISRYEREALNIKNEVFSAVMSEVNLKEGAVIRPRFGLKPLAVAASFLVIFLAGFMIVQYLPNEHGGVKDGGATPQSIMLKVAVLKKNAGSLVRAMRGESYNRKDVLFFRYELETPGYVYLIRNDDNSHEIIHAPDKSDPVQGVGVYEFRDGDNIQGFPLEGLAGRQIFLVLASDRLLDPEKDISALIDEYSRKDVPVSGKSWALDSFELIVADNGE